MKLFFHKDKNQEKYISEYIEHFFDDNKLKKDDLRVFIHSQLTKFSSELHDILYLKKNELFWRKLSDKVAILEDQPKLAACNQIKSLPDQVNSWIKETVESSERFEFFIISKAAELNCGDHDKDYYNAMLIRHDQLLAVNYTFERAIKHLNNCLKYPPQEVPDSDDFQFFTSKTIEDRIYKMAELTYKTRKKLGKL